MKTGSPTAELHCLISLAEKNSTEVLSVSLGTGVRNQFESHV